MEIDLHGMNLFQARNAVASALRRATAADYRLRVVHGRRVRHGHGRASFSYQIASGRAQPQPQRNHPGPREY